MAATWRLDLKAAEVGDALESAGIATILLKGRALASLLYGAQPPRQYSDCDLYVSPRDSRRAQAVLAGLCFEPRYGFALEGDPSAQATGQVRHAGEWVRESDGFVVDLHHRPPLTGVDPGVAWDLLSTRTQALDVQGWKASVLDRPATALLCALHAAHDGPRSVKPLRDLELAVEQLDAATWSDAMTLATRLDAVQAFGTGLRLSSDGAPLADRLGAAWAPSTEMMLAWDGAPWGASVWEALARASGVRARAAALAAVALPRAEDLRLRSSLARRGNVGLLVARVVHPLRVARRALPGFLAWRRALRRTETWRSA